VTALESDADEWQQAKRSICTGGTGFYAHIRRDRSSEKVRRGEEQLPGGPILFHASRLSSSCHIMFYSIIGPAFMIDIIVDRVSLAFLRLIM
ncbi:hypothetical protein KIN20_030866, partial [Parelaphostrongylus tenuis]